MPAYKIEKGRPSNFYCELYKLYDLTFASVNLQGLFKGLLLIIGYDIYN